MSRKPKHLLDAIKAANAARESVFSSVTCPCSRHVHLMAKVLADGKPYPMFDEEPQHCAESMLVVVAELWKARRKLQELNKT